MTTVDDAAITAPRVRRVTVAPPRPTPERRRPASAPARRRVQPAVPVAEVILAPEAASATVISPVTTIRHVLTVFGVGIVAALLLSGRGLVHAGYGMPDGPERTIALGVGQPLQFIEDRVGLTIPWDAAERALGRGTATSSAPLLSAPSVTPTLPSTSVPTVNGPHGQAGNLPRAGTPAPRSTSTTPVLTPPTKANPLRLLVTGDSLTEFMGPQLDDMAARLGPVTAWADTHYGTGLVRPDFVDWSLVARQQVATYHPEAVVMLLGGNDFQNMVVAGGKILAAASPAWTREYARRAEVVMQTWMAGGARRVYWLSLPPARSEAWSRNNAQINLAIKEAVSRVPGAEFVNIVGPLTNGGTYADFVMHDGQETLVREPDGIHLNEMGSQIAAGEVLRVLNREWHIAQLPAPGARHRARPKRVSARHGSIPAAPSH